MSVGAVGGILYSENSTSENGNPQIIQKRQKAALDNPRNRVLVWFFSI